MGWGTLGEGPFFPPLTIFWLAMLNNPLGGQQELPQVVGQSQVLPLLGDRHAPL